MQLAGKPAGAKKKKYSMLQFSDVVFYRYLETIGLSPKKSLTLGEIKVGPQYFPDFLRGVIDGDGCIHTWIHASNGHQQWALRITSAAFVFSTWLKKSTEGFFHVRGRLHACEGTGHRHTVYVIKFGKLAGKIILDRIYYDGCLSLERKMLKSRVCLQDANRMVNYGNVLCPGAVIGSQN